MNTYYDMAIDTYKSALSALRATSACPRIIAVLCHKAIKCALRSIAEQECVDAQILYINNIAEICEAINGCKVCEPIDITKVLVVEKVHTKIIDSDDRINVPVKSICECMGATEYVLDITDHYRNGKGMRTRHRLITSFEHSVWMDYCIKYNIESANEETTLRHLEAQYDLTGTELFMKIQRSCLYTTSRDEALPGRDLIVKFEKDLNKAKRRLQDYTMPDIKYGIFGSYARGKFRATSDIDILAIWPSEPKTLNVEYAILSSDLDSINCQLTSVSQRFFETDTTLFAREIRRDFKVIL